MKRAARTSETTRNFDQLISKLSENEILNPQAMSHVKGGQAEGEGSIPILIMPK